MNHLSGYVHVCCLLRTDHDDKRDKRTLCLVFELPTEQLFLICSCPKLSQRDGYHCVQRHFLIVTYTVCKRI